MNAAGGYSTSIPLVFPPTRDGLPVPLSIVSGGRTVGAAGLGWDVALSYIRNDDSIAKRKPLDAPGLTVRGRRHVTLSLAGQMIDLVYKSYAPGANLWVSRGDHSLYTAFQNGTSWTVFDGESHRYEFAASGVAFDAGLALLKSVWGPGGVKEMELGYSVHRFALVAGQPPQAFSVDLTRISYNFHPNMGCAKDEIDLVYNGSVSIPLSASALSGELYFRDHVLSSVTVRSRTSCVNATTLRTYELQYVPDVDTKQPRLDSVFLHGRTGTPEESNPLTLAVYHYNNVTNEKGLTYVGVTSTAALPSGANPNAISAEAITSQSTPDRTWYATTQDLLDVTGDGIPDMIFVRNGVVWSARGSARVGGGISFAPAVPLGDTVVKIANSIRSRAVGHDTADNTVDDDNVRYDREQTWKTTIDINGDGRIDIIDALEEAGHWTVYLNTPSTGPSGVAWVKRSIPVQQLMSLLHKHDLGDGQHLALSRRFTGTEVVLQHTSHHPIGYGRSTTFTEWDLKDLNGDGLPDFVFDSTPAYFHEQSANGYDFDYRYTPMLSRHNQVEVLYDVGGITLDPAPAGTTSVFSAANMVLDHSTTCGVEKWLDGYLHCTFADLTGDGIPERIEFIDDGAHSHFATWVGLGFHFSPKQISLPIQPGVFTTVGEHCATDSHSEYQSRIDAVIRDVTGDGLPDLVGANGIYVGTGFGFRSDPVPTHGLSVSWQTHACDGSSRTTAGLYDLDGDGRPELVAIDGAGNLDAVAPSVEGVPLAQGTGQITSIDGPYGATTWVSYHSAKEDSLTSHQVPFPEVVVAAVTMTLVSQPGNTRRTSYAYGDASLVYDNIAGGFVFSGYRRTVSMTTFVQPGDASGLKAVGKATITDTNAEPPFASGMTDDQRFARRMIVGRTSSVTSLAGSLGVDANTLLATDVVSDYRVIARTTFDYQTKLFVAPPGPEEGVLDCVDLVDPYDYEASLAYVFNVYDTCSAHGFTYVAKTRTVRGSQTTNANVTVATEVQEIDDYARPLRIMYVNDVERPEDDLCVNTTYADSIGTVPVLDAVATRRVWGCDKNPVTYSYDTFQYDGHPTGSAGDGRTTSQTTERHATDDGTTLASIHVFDASYDAVGNISSLVRVRDEDGALRQTTYTYDPFGLVRTRVQVAASNLPTFIWTATFDQVSMMPLSQTDATGTVRSVAYDGFDRDVSFSIAPVGSTAGVVSTTSYVGFTDGTGRRIVSTSFDDPVPEANLAGAKGHTTTVYLDELGRPSRSESPLGDDYPGQTLMTYRIYDPSGRVAFASEPFLSADDHAKAFGTSFFYNADDTPNCSVRANGPHAYATDTDAPNNVFVTCYYHGYSNHLETFGISASDANDPGTQQAGLIDRQSVTALGRPVSQSKTRAGATLEYSTFVEDRFGNVTSMTRYKTPASVTNPVTTSWRYDSAGNKIGEQKPESAAVSMKYDSWGELISTEWLDSGTDRSILNLYDSLGRLAHREERNAGVTDAESVFSYFYDEPLTVSPEVSPTNTLGRLSKATGPASTIYFSYDGYGVVNARTHVDGSSNRYIEKETHEANGNLIGLDMFAPDTGYQKEHVDYTYDSAARNRSVYYIGPTSSASLFKSGTIDAYGHLLTATFGGETQYAAVYDASGRRLMRHVEVVTPSGKRTFTFKTYDALGRVVADVEANDLGETHATQAYDALGRLSETQRLGATASKWKFSYDALGNIVKAQDAMSTTVGVGITYDLIDKDRICKVTYQGITSGNGCNFTYDAVGNVVKETTRTGSRKLSYFDAGDIRTISDENGKAEFRYGPLGGFQELTIQAANDSRHDRHYGALFDVKDDHSSAVTSSLIERKIPGPAGVAASLRGATDKWVFAFGDGHGLRFTTDINGKYLQDVSYSPYGAAKSSGETASSTEYSNEQWNGGDAFAAFGLVNVGARLYDPAIGRFLSRDPIQLRQSANAANPYAFARNDPLNASDPSGMCDPEDIACWVVGDSGTSGAGINGNGHEVDPTPPRANAPHTTAPPSIFGPSSSYPDGCPPEGACHGPNDGREDWETEAMLRASVRDAANRPAWKYGYEPDNSPGIFQGLGKDISSLLDAIHDYAVDSTTDGLTNAWANTAAGTYDVYGIPHPGKGNIIAEVRPQIRPVVEVGVTVAEQLLILALTEGAGEGAAFGPRGAQIVPRVPGTACFVAGTLVLTARGEIPIEKVQANDQAWAYDSQTDRWSWRPIKRLWAHDYEGAVVSLVMGADEIRATANHPFCVVKGRNLTIRPAVRALPTGEAACAQGGRWVEAKGIEKGDLVATASGTALVNRATQAFERLQVFNLTVSQAKTYAVSRAKVLVHNKPMVSAEFWAKDYANQVLKSFKESGVGDGARSGMHGVPYNRAATFLENAARTGRVPATDGGQIELLEEIRDALRGIAGQFRQRAREINHPMK